MFNVIVPPWYVDMECNLRYINNELFGNLGDAMKLWLIVIYEKTQTIIQVEY